MKFEWDDTKNKFNIRKHGIDFNDIPELFNYPMLTLLDDRGDYEENRWISIGLLSGLVGVVVYTELEGNIIRIISARKATKREVKGYAERVKNEFGTS